MTDTENQPVGVDPNIAATVIADQISDPKSSQGIFDLPCGFLDKEGNLHTEIKVREISGYEEDMLANAKLKSNKKINNLITSCLERLGDITDKGKLAQAVLDMTVGDRLFTIFSIRRVTVGDKYLYQSKCPDCKTTHTLSADLSEVEIKHMPSPHKRVYEFTLPRSNKVVKITPMTGRGEEKLTTLSSKQKEDSLSLSLAMRITEIDGERPSLKDVKSLSSVDRTFLRGKFDEIEGGLDTTTEVECPSCFSTYEEDLDVSQASFFFPTETQES